MKGLPITLVPAFACILAGCSPPLAVAGLALDLLQPGTGSSAFTNPYDRPPGENLQDALSGLRDEPDPRCLDALAAQRREAATSKAAAEPAPGGSADAETGPPVPAAPTAAMPAEKPAEVPGEKPGVQLVCLPGTTAPIALFLRPGTSRSEGAAPAARPAGDTSPAIAGHRAGHRE